MRAWHWQGLALIAFDIVCVWITVAHNTGVGFTIFFAIMAGLTAGVMLERT